MAKPAAPRDGVTVVIPAHNAATALDQVLPAWGAVLNGLGRPFEILVVNDGSTDNTAAVLEKRLTNVPHLRVLKHDTHVGFGACLRTALAEAKYPLFVYAGVDYPYVPSDIKVMLERIEVRDEVFGKQPDLISGARSGQQQPELLKWIGRTWKLFWRLFAGLPMTEAPPWYGWGAWWYRVRTSWVFGVPLADVNSAFKLYRTAFLKRVPIQSDGAFVHTELVAKATFLTSIMDEVPLTQKPDPLPALGPIAADRRKVFHNPEFAIREPAPDVKPPAPSNAPTPAVPPAEPTLAPAANAATTTAPEVRREESVSLPSTSNSNVSGTNVVPPTTQPPEPTKTTTDQPPAEPAKKDQPTAESSKPTPASTTEAATSGTAVKPPAAESPKPVEGAAAPAPSTKPETPKPAAEAPPQTAPPSSDTQPEPKAGGLNSPGSPVPAT
jgi:glycosyltransferase involved in cell wall biosynthesis